MKMRLTLQLLLSLLLLCGCRSPLFSSKETPAAPASSDADEATVRETLLKAPIVELYKSLTFVSDDSAFEVAGYDFGGLRTQLEAAAVDVQNISDLYPDLETYFREESIPLKAELSIVETKSAVENAYQNFLSSSHASSVDCEAKPQRGADNFSSFSACARIAAQAGLSKSGLRNLNTFMGWAWNRGECAVTLASELLQIAQRGKRKALCSEKEPLDTNSLPELNNTKK